MLLKRITIILAVGLAAYLLLGAKCADSFKKKVSPKPAQQTNYVYDTDPRNNEFIKGGLSSQKLAVLDRVLREEKKQGGLMLSNTDLNRITRYDQEINEAYGRWIKCKNMMRSSHHVIYPDER